MTGPTIAGHTMPAHMHTNRLIKVLGMAAVAALAMARPAQADGTELRIATLAPSGSPWMEVLDKAAGEIKDKSGGRVSLKYFEGGQQGDERDFVRKINLGQLDGAAVTAVGLSMIDESIRVLELPMMFQSTEEFDYVADKMWPHFQKKFEKKGFKLTDRGEVGWIYFLSKAKVEKISDLQGQKLWLWNDDQLVGAVFKKLGLNGVPLGVPEVDAALTSGKIDALLRLAGRGGRAAVVLEGQVHDVDADELRDGRHRGVDQGLQEAVARRRQDARGHQPGQREEAAQDDPQGQRGRQGHDEPQGRHRGADPDRDGRRLHQEGDRDLERARRQDLLEGRAQDGARLTATSTARSTRSSATDRFGVSPIESAGTCPLPSHSERIIRR